MSTVSVAQGNCLGIDLKLKLTHTLHMPCTAHVRAKAGTVEFAINYTYVVWCACVVFWVFCFVFSFPSPLVPPSFIVNSHLSHRG